MAQARKILEKRPSAAFGGAPVSLRDVGFSDVGLDDGWQACQTKDPRGVFAPLPKPAPPSYNYHDRKTGKPLVNTTRFPNFPKMVDEIHRLGLTASFYANNCGCAEQQGQWPNVTDQQTRGDVDLILQSKFDGVKLDGCGPANNLTRWVELLREKQGGKNRVVVGGTIYGSSSCCGTSRAARIGSW